MNVYKYFSCSGSCFPPPILQRCRYVHVLWTLTMLAYQTFQCLQTGCESRSSLDLWTLWPMPRALWPTCCNLWSSVNVVSYKWLCLLWQACTYYIPIRCWHFLKLQGFRYIGMHVMSLSSSDLLVSAITALPDWCASVIVLFDKSVVPFLWLHLFLLSFSAWLHTTISQNSFMHCSFFTSF